ncbi:TolC family protein [uncultured Acetobacteroides sp.]|uniref:TolC family protein n=1 Tax=uncultured Acetobacteroides sp. TaxID=1760811 RepID=UPI0029F5B6A0|nr:TolC family protein [uncultured Acetobacteroides sp.]
MKLRPFSILTLLLIGSVGAQAQEPWGLERCIQYAISNNITIKQQELNVAISENAVKQAQWSQTPTLSANGSQSVSFGRSLDNTNYTYIDKTAWSGSLGFGSQVTLFGGFNTRNTISKNKLDLQSSLLEVERTKNDISLNIAAAYLQVLFSEEVVSNSEKQVELTKMQVERTQKLVDAGNLSQSSLLDIRSQQAQEEVTLVNAQNQLVIAYLTLKQLLELSADTPFKVEHPTKMNVNDQYVLSNPNQLFEISQNLPQIKSSEVKLQSAEKGIMIARSAYYPSFILSAQYGSNYFSPKNTVLGQDPITGAPIVGKQSISDQLNKNQSTNINLSLRIPIFNSMRTKFSISNARIGYSLAQLDLQQRKNTLYKEISQAHADAVGALKKYAATQKASEALAESFNNIDKKFNVGAANSLDYNTAKNNLSKSESELLQAKYQFIFKTKILDFYKGVPIKL